MFLQKSANLFAENRLLKFAIVIIGGAVILNIFMTQKAFNSMRVIITPPVVDSKMEITGYGADEQYIKKMSRYILGLALTYTPATAKKQFNELLAMFSPETFQGARQTFNEMAETVETTGTSSVFYIQKIVHDPDASLIEVSGLKRQEIEGVRVQDEKRTYAIGYRFEQGRFWITEITEKEK